jgi:predicted phage-related endonuclease
MIAAWRGVAWLGWAWLGMVRQGKAGIVFVDFRRGVAWRGSVWRGVVRQGKAGIYLLIMARSGAARRGEVGIMKPKRIKIERIKIVSREQWLRLRAGDVTASTVGAIFNLHPYETPMGLFAAKTGVVMPDVDTQALRRGRLLEGAVAKAFQEMHPGWKVTKANVYLRAPALRLGATPDFFITDETGRHGTLQTKTVAPMVFRKSWTDETPPTWISLQTLTEAMLARADFAMIAALEVDGFRFALHEYRVPRHPSAERRILDGVARFWSDIAAGRTPEFQPADRSLLAVMFPRETPGTTVDLRGDNELPGLLRKRERYKSLIDQIKERQHAIETNLMAKMGSNETALVNDWRITFKQQHRKAYEVKETDFRVLRIARDKEKAA